MTDFKALPDEKVISEASNIDILDYKGEKVKFGSLFEQQKTIVVFIRHFGCGACQSYVEDLGAVSKDALDRAGTRVVVIGCGEASVIAVYKGVTHFPGEIYADPSRVLYKALGMTIETFQGTPAGQKKPSYLKSGLALQTLQSMWRGILHPSMIGKQGNLGQIGGDFVFGPGNVCTFSSRMRNTEDHVEVADLMKAAGVEYP